LKLLYFLNLVRTVGEADYLREDYWLLVWTAFFIIIPVETEFLIGTFPCFDCENGIFCYLLFEISQLSSNSRETQSLYYDQKQYPVGTGHDLLALEGGRGDRRSCDHVSSLLPVSESLFSIEVF
jgi:hypothetical protein